MAFQQSILYCLTTNDLPEICQIIYNIETGSLENYIVELQVFTPARIKNCPKLIALVSGYARSAYPHPRHPEIYGRSAGRKIVN
jgi:hypothetical protein